MKIIQQKFGDLMKDKSPSIQEWKNLYSAAVEFKKLKPWEWMWDDDIFGVKNPETGEIGFCCVMGGGGEHFALGLYQGSEGLDGLSHIRSGEILPDDPEALFVQKCLMASFENREFIEDDDYQILRKLGLRFRGENAWPLFRSYQPGYVPWYVTDDEARFLTLALEQAIQVCRRYYENPDVLTPPMMTQLLVRVPDGDTWQDEWLEPWDLEEKEVMVGSVNEEDLEEILKFPHKGVLEGDYYLYLEPIQEETDQRPYFPQTILWADHESGLILNTTLSEPSEWVPSFLKSFQEVTESRGSLPCKILVQKVEIYELMENITSQLDIELSLETDLDVIDKAKEHMLNTSMDDPVVQVLEGLMEDESFRQMVENGKLNELLEEGTLPDSMREELIQALKEELEESGGEPDSFMINPPEKKANEFQKQTTLFPDDNYQGILQTESERKFQDKPRDAAQSCEVLLETYSDESIIKKELEKLIKEDPDFLDSYLILSKIFIGEGKESEAEKTLDIAYHRALNLITDEKDCWPAKLEDSWIPNWHIINAILRKAMWLWEHDKTDDALNLLRKLLKTNPHDLFGVRHYILAISMGRDYNEFLDWIVECGNDKIVKEWFEENYQQFLDEFASWREEAGNQ